MKAIALVIQLFAAQVWITTDTTDTRHLEWEWRDLRYRVTSIAWTWRIEGQFETDATTAISVPVAGPVCRQRGDRVWVCKAKVLPIMWNRCVQIWASSELAASPWVFVPPAPLLKDDKRPSPPCGLRIERTK